jgi:transforming growth factor-beta-induced protein
VVADLLLPENQAALASILLYHVVPGIVPAVDVVRSSTFRAASGRILEVNVTEEGVFINKSRIEVVNLLASNGLIHVIEAVLLPGQVIQVESLVRTGNEVRVTWSGGLPPYRVEHTLEIDGEWSTVAETSDPHVDLPLEGATGFFRVVGNVE